MTQICIGKMNHVLVPAAREHRNAVFLQYVHITLATHCVRVAFQLPEQHVGAIKFVLFGVVRKEVLRNLPEIWSIGCFEETDNDVSRYIRSFFIFLLNGMPSHPMSFQHSEFRPA